MRLLRDTKCIKILATTSLAIGFAENVSCQAEIPDGERRREGDGGIEKVRSNQMTTKTNVRCLTSACPSFDGELYLLPRSYPDSPL